MLRGQGDDNSRLCNGRHLTNSRHPVQDTVTVAGNLCGVKPQGRVARHWGREAQAHTHTQFMVIPRSSMRPRASMGLFWSCGKGGGPAGR